MTVGNQLITTNGLQMLFDSSSRNGYKGPAIMNRFGAINGSVGVGTATGYVVTSASETSVIPQLGMTTYTSAYIQNNYTSFTPNSTNCCPSLFSYGSGISVTPSTLYTYAIVYRCDSGYTNANYMYRYEYVSNGGAYISEGGVHNTANRIHLGGGWYWAWGTFTTSATTTWLGYCAAFYYQYSSGTDRLSIAKSMLVQGDYSQLHPKYWPDPSTQRLIGGTYMDQGPYATQAVGIGIFGGSLTYSNSGAPSFVGGSSNYLDLGNTVYTQFPYNAPWSIQIVCNITAAVNTYPGIMIKGSSASIGVLLYYVGGSLLFKHNNAQVVACSYTLGTAFMITITYNGKDTLSCYKNGLYTAGMGAMAGTETTSSLMLGRGDEYGTSTLYHFSKYNIALTAAEVYQNYIAFKGQYGI